MEKLVIPKGCRIQGTLEGLSNPGDIWVLEPLALGSLVSEQGSVNYQAPGLSLDLKALEAGAEVRAKAASLKVHDVRAGQVHLTLGALDIAGRLETDGDIAIKAGGHIALGSAAAQGAAQLECATISADEITGADVSLTIGEDGAVKEIHGKRITISGNLHCEKIVATEAVHVTSGKIKVRLVESPAFHAEDGVKGIVMMANSEDVRAGGVRGFLHPDDMDLLSGQGTVPVITPSTNLDEPEDGSAPVPPLEAPMTDTRSFEDEPPAPSAFTGPVSDFEPETLEPEPEASDPVFEPEPEPEPLEPEELNSADLEEEEMLEPIEDAVDPASGWETTLETTPFNREDLEPEPQWTESVAAELPTADFPADEETVHDLSQPEASSEDAFAGPIVPAPEPGEADYETVETTGMDTLDTYDDQEPEPLMEPDFGPGEDDMLTPDEEEEAVLEDMPQPIQVNTDDFTDVGELDDVPGDTLNGDALYELGGEDEDFSDAETLTEEDVEELSSEELDEVSEDIEELGEEEILGEMVEEEEDPEAILQRDLLEILDQVRELFPGENYPRSIDQIRGYVTNQQLSLFMRARNRESVVKNFEKLNAKFDHDLINENITRFFQILDDHMA